MRWVFLSREGPELTRFLGGSEIQGEGVEAASAELGLDLDGGAEDLRACGQVEQLDDLGDAVAGLGQVADGVALAVFLPGVDRELLAGRGRPWVAPAGG